MVSESAAGAANTGLAGVDILEVGSLPRFIDLVDFPSVANRERTITRYRLTDKFQSSVIEVSPYGGERETKRGLPRPWDASQHWHQAQRQVSGTFSRGDGPASSPLTPAGPEVDWHID